MDRESRRRFALVLVVALAATAAAALLVNGGTNRPGGSGNESSVTGVVVGVQSEGLDRVRGFTLRTQDGASFAFSLGDLQNGVAFPPGHLVEHQATGQPVRVSYVTDDGVNAAIRIEDAP
jgi:hypothetical protein